MNPITKMAFYCCGVRMDDAENAQSLCEDVYAKRFMDAQGLAIYDLFKDELNCNASMIVRHRIIDDLLRRQLSAKPNLCVITIGAGFDSRPYRLQGGTWFELDEPEILDCKNQHLPADHSPNPLQRIPIQFGVDAIEQKLKHIKHKGNVVIVMEGVFIYLDEQETVSSLRVFHQLFPTHQIIADLVNREMVETYGRTLNEKIEGIGTLFKSVDYPEKVFTSNDYRVKHKISLLEKAADFGISKIPKSMLKCFFNGDVYGNSIYVFESHELYSDLVF